MTNDPVCVIGRGRGANPRSRANLRVQPRVYYVAVKRGPEVPWTNEVGGPWTFHVAARKADAIENEFKTRGLWPYHGWMAAPSKELR
jgi:hypothetical protein